MAILNFLEEYRPIKELDSNSLGPYRCEERILFLVCCNRTVSDWRLNKGNKGVQKMFSNRRTISNFILFCSGVDAPLLKWQIL